MTRLPVPGSDDDKWGSILNDFLSVEHQVDGMLKIRTDGTLSEFYAKPSGGIPASDLDSSVQASLTRLDAAVQSVNGKAPNGSGAVVIAEADIANLTADLASKASDAATVHASGDETIAGTKTFTDGIVTAVFKLTTLPVAGYVLTTDAVGQASWQDPAAQGIAFAVALG